MKLGKKRLRVAKKSEAKRAPVACLPEYFS